MTHAPASPSAALSASEQRASGIRAPSLSPAPTQAEHWCRWLPGGGQSTTHQWPAPGRCALGLTSLGASTRNQAPPPRAPLKGSPRASLAVCHRPPSALFLLEKKTNKARLQPSQPLFSPPEGAPGVGERRARNALPLAAAGCPRGQNCPPTSLRDPPHRCILKKASRGSVRAGSPPQIT